MSNEKEVSEEDKVTHTNEEIQEVQGNSIESEKVLEPDVVDQIEPELVDQAELEAVDQAEPEVVEHEHEEEIAESVDYSDFSKNPIGDIIMHHL